MCAAVKDQKWTRRAQRHSSLQNRKQYDIDCRSSVGFPRVGCPASAAGRENVMSHLYKLEKKYIHLRTRVIHESLAFHSCSKRNLISRVGKMAIAIYKLLVLKYILRQKSVVWLCNAKTLATIG